MSIYGQNFINLFFDEAPSHFQYDSESSSDHSPPLTRASSDPISEEEGHLDAIISPSLELGESQ
jgi:hypothetical protein